MADGGSPGAVVFTASGNLVIPSGVTEIVVEAWGGGGGGAPGEVCLSGTTAEGLGGGGGGAGGYVRALLAVTAGQTYKLVVGSGGPTLPLSGGNGTSTTLSLGSTALVTANGGAGAPNSVAQGDTCPTSGGAGGAGGSVAVAGGAVVIDESSVNGGSSAVANPNPGSAGAAGGNAGEAGGGGHGGSPGENNSDLSPGNPGLVIVTFAL